MRQNVRPLTRPCPSRTLATMPSICSPAWPRRRSIIWSPARLLVLMLLLSDAVFTWAMPPSCHGRANRCHGAASLWRLSWHWLRHATRERQRVGQRQAGSASRRALQRLQIQRRSDSCGRGGDLLSVERIARDPRLVAYRTSHCQKGRRSFSVALPLGGCGCQAFKGQRDCLRVAVPLGAFQPCHQQRLGFGVLATQADQSAKRDLRARRRTSTKEPEEPLLREGGPCNGALGDRLRSEEHTSELQSRENLVCRLLHEKKKQNIKIHNFTKKNKQNSNS